MKRKLATCVAGAAVAVAGCGGGKLSQTEIVDKVKPTAVRITGKSGGGSGVVVDAKRGLVLTNAHVVFGLEGMKASVGDQSSTETPARLVAAAPCEDLAVIELVDKPPNLRQAKLGDSSKVKTGEHVTALGYPGNLQDPNQTGGTGQAATLNANSGTVSQANLSTAPDASSPKFAAAIQHQAPINPGNSGSPLVDDDGEVVGLNTFSSAAEGAQGQNYAIASSRIKQLLPDLEAGKSQANLGWDLQALADTDLPKVFANDPDFRSQGARALGTRVERALKKIKEDGVYVNSSQDGSPAQKANPPIGGGDLIQYINGTAVSSYQDVCDIVSAKRPGEKLTIDARQINSGSTMDSILKPFKTEVTVK